MFTEDNLRHSLTEIGASLEGTLFHDLDRAYREPARHYHSHHHIAACLRHVQSYRHLARCPAEIEVALWFHDAIYDTHRQDNEAQSAAWARQYLQSVGTAADCIARIVGLILATRHNAVALEGDQALLVDIDLAILGQSPEVFHAYDTAIRTEYAWVPWEQYRAGRVKILTGFLERPCIYTTAALREVYEVRARQNLHEALQQLREGRKVTR